MPREITLSQVRNRKKTLDCLQRSLMRRSGQLPRAAKSRLIADKLLSGSACQANPLARLAASSRA
jgi:hypothetical protein